MLRSDRVPVGRTMTLSLKSRARALAEHHQAEVADALYCVAAGYPDRLLKASWKGRLDRDIACLVRDIEKERNRGEDR